MNEHAHNHEPCEACAMPQGWSCQKCTLNNEAGAHTCASCGHRPGPVEGSGWNCSSCSYHNSDESNCEMCGAGPPAAAIGVEKTPTGVEKTTPMNGEAAQATTMTSEGKVDEIVRVSGAEVRKVLRRLSTITPPVTSTTGSSSSSNSSSSVLATSVEENVVGGLEDDEGADDEEMHLAKLHKVQAVLTQSTPIIPPIAKIISCYLEDFVVLFSSKDPQNGHFAVYAPHLIAQSSVMEMKLVSTETRYVIEASVPVVREVVRYINSHRTKIPPAIEKPLRSKIMKDVCACPWDARFIDEIGEDRQLLYDVILLANYLNIQSLLHLACAKVASLIKGKPLEQIKNILAVSPGTPTVSSDEVSASQQPQPAVKDATTLKCLCSFH